MVKRYGGGNSMNFQTIELKVANMRKAQQFVIYPNGTSKDAIVLQSDKSIATLNTQTGVFKINTKGKRFVDMINSEVVELDGATKETIKRMYSAKQNGSNGQITLIGGAEDHVQSVKSS
jgi:ribosomal protein L25 (general stress protein Ctc)